MFYRVLVSIYLFPLFLEKSTIKTQIMSHSGHGSHEHAEHFKKVIKDHKKEIGVAAIGVGVIAAGALLAGGAYAYHEHAEGQNQGKSPTRLHIRLHNATDLNKDGESFIAMQVGHATIKSKIAEQSANPTWDQEFEVGIIRGKTVKLHVEALDKEKFVNDTLGHADIDLSEINSEPTKISLELKGGKNNTGHVHLTLWISG